jgi:rRNA-processing protein FCF1
VKIKLSHIPNAFIFLDSCSLLNIYQFYKRFFQDVVIPFSKKSKRNFQFIIPYNVTQEIDNIKENRSKPENIRQSAKRYNSEVDELSKGGNFSISFCKDMFSKEKLTNDENIVKSGLHFFKKVFVDYKKPFYIVTDDNNLSLKAVHNGWERNYVISSSEFIIKWK